MKAGLSQLPCPVRLSLVQEEDDDLGLIHPREREAPAALAGTPVA